MKKGILFSIVCFVFHVSCFSQAKHKAMIIPFEPRLYMSQVDHKFNAETKLTQKQIKETFRKGINNEFAAALKKQYDVLDLMKDTAKYKKDILTIYKNLTYKFTKVPDQNNYKSPADKKNTKQETIKKGQLVVETNADARFMNAEIISPSLIPALYTKYKTDLFVFINQLDIFSDAISTNEMGTLSERTLTIHYTVYSVDAKEINSGVCSIKIPADVNNPAKIVSSYISKVATEVVRRINTALAKIDADKKK